MAKELSALEVYYNKFNEDKRLDSRHGRVEFLLSIKYIHKYLETLGNPEDLSIIDIGAGTGRYSIPLSEEGYQMTAVELVPNNLGRIKKNGPKVKSYQGNAVKLKRFKENEFDAAILFGPMYHLHSKEEKCKALSEAVRVVKPGGFIFVAYVMNEYAILTYGFKEKHILESLNSGLITSDYHVADDEKELYSFMRIEDIDALNETASVKREVIFSPDGAANYMRPFLNQLTEEEFSKFIAYQESVCERTDLLGAAAHTVDVLRV